VNAALRIAEHFDHEIYNTTAVVSDKIVPKTLGVIDRHGEVPVLAPYCDARAPSATSFTSERFGDIADVRRKRQASSTLHG
jgi:hypothetical protein